METAVLVEMNLPVRNKTRDEGRKGQEKHQ